MTIDVARTPMNKLSITRVSDPRKLWLWGRKVLSNYRDRPRDSRAHLDGPCIEWKLCSPASFEFLHANGSSIYNCHCRIMSILIMSHYLARFDQVRKQPFVKKYVLPSTTIFRLPAEHFPYERKEVALVLTRETLLAAFEASCWNCYLMYPFS